MKHKQRAFSRVSKVIGKFSARTDLSTFRNEFRTAVDPLDPKTRDFLLQAREWLEGWQLIDNTSAILSQWSELYETAQKLKVPSLAVAFVRKLPRSTANNLHWKHFLTQCSDPRIARAIFDRKLVDKPTLLSWLNESLQDMYPSAALDIAIEKRVFSDVRHLWKESLRLGNRREPLLSQEEVLAWCYCNSTLNSIDDRFLSFLARPTTTRHRSLTFLFSHTHGALRFARYLVTQVSRKRSRPFAGDVLNELIGLCESRLSQLPTTQDTAIAALLLGTIRMHLIVAQCEPRTAPPDKIVIRVSGSCEGFAKATLMRLEENVRSADVSLPLTLTGSELLLVVHGHLKALPTLTKHEANATGRHEQFQSHLGRKEAIHGIVEALDHANDESELRDELEVMLYNMGVRQLGTIGSHEGFDLRCHQASTSDILPGDLVEVVKPGRRIGDATESLVVKRAIVRSCVKQ